jgi:polysaccharide deacetylase family protein (PEP-CTERM system associated)
MKNFFSVDFEDWYQGIGLPFSSWNLHQKRLEIGTNILLELFQKYNTKATFFMLGKAMEEHPGIIRSILSEGHEIACHTYTHPFLYEISQAEFELELENCNKLSAEYGVRLKGFRAPYFSVDSRSLWVLNSLQNFGYLYDSSIFPGDTKRTGIADANPNIHTIENSLIEVPITKFKLSKFDVGTGGAYFRILPYWYFKQKIKEIESIRPINFYIHPWELDPKHPYLNYLSRRIQYTHYFNLKSTKNKLERLLGDFEFSSFARNLNL